MTDLARAAEAAARDEVNARIRVMLSSLTPKRRRLATLVLDEPYFVALASAEQLGDRADVDAATVVRFSRQVGYGGYSELRDAIRRRLPQLTPVEKVRRHLDEGGSSDRGVLSDSYEQDSANISRLAADNPPEGLEEVARRLLAARTIVVLSGGLSDAVSSTLVHLLRLVGLPAVHRPDEVSAAVDVARVGAADVVIAVSFWRYVTSTMRLFSLAKERGAWTVALTDSRGAPVAERADHVLTAPVDAPEVSLSVVAPLALVNGLASLCAALAPEQAVAALSAVDDVYSASKIAVPTTDTAGKARKAR